MGWLGEGITMQGLLLGCAKGGLGTALLVGDGVGTLVGVPVASKNSIRPKNTIFFYRKFGN